MFSSCKPSGTCPHCGASLSLSRICATQNNIILPNRLAQNLLGLKSSWSQFTDTKIDKLNRVQQMKRRAFFFIYLFLFILTHTPPAFADTIIQLATNQGRNIFVNDNQNGIGQSFIPLVDRYETLGIYLYQATSSQSLDTTITFALYQGELNAQDLTPLSSAEIDLGSFSGGKFQLALDSVAFTPHTPYAFALFNDTDEWMINFVNDGFDHYTDGSMYLCYSNEFFPLSTPQDLKFTIETSQVPLPPTISLFASGLLALIPLLRRRYC